MNWKLLSDESPGVRGAAIALYWAWFESQEEIPPIAWQDLVDEDKARFFDAAVSGLIEVFESVYDRRIDPE